MGPVKRPDLVEPELSYQIVGALYEVFNEVGTGHRETVYQKALLAALQQRGLHVEEQVPAPLVFRAKVIGRWRLDFLVEGRVVLEIKRGERIVRHDILQVLEYLKTKHLQLGMVANFSSHGLQWKRVVNLW